MKYVHYGLFYLVMVLARWECWIRAWLRPHRPFTPKQIEEIRKRDSVPDKLLPFLDFVHQWGGAKSDTERYALADYAEPRPRLMRELEGFTHAWTPDLQTTYDNWFRSVHNDTAFKFMFTLSLLYDLGFKFQHDAVSVSGDRIPQLIEVLKSPGLDRMRAALRLPDYEEDALAAIPHLLAALDDQDRVGSVGVRYALARLTGDRSPHRKAIESIRDSATHEITRVQYQDALDKLERTQEQHRLNALCGFCILNEVNYIARISEQVDVNGLDHNGRRPLEYVAGNQNADAVRVLLEHGANPNLPDKNGDRLLHDAASRRDNGKILSLLAKHGADLQGKNAKGRTPIQIARKYRRDSNVKVLSHLLASGRMAAD